MPVAPSPLHFDHVAIPVSDVGASVRFYGETFGLPLVRAMSGDDWEGRAWLLIFYKLADDRMIALTAFRPHADTADAQSATLPADARHYALATDDLATWRRRLEDAGLAVREEDHGDQQALFVSDPDGVVWELVSPAGGGSFENGDKAAAIIEAWEKA